MKRYPGNSEKLIEMSAKAQAANEAKVKFLYQYIPRVPDSSYTITGPLKNC